MKYSQLLILLLLAGCSDSSPTSTPYIPPDPIVAETPKQRVNAFIQDWHGAWAHVVASDPVVARNDPSKLLETAQEEMTSGDDFQEGLEKLRAAMPTAEDIQRLSEKWGHTEFAVEQRHFTESGIGPDSPRGYSHEATHDPAVESIVDSEIDGPNATVETTSDREYPEFYVYELQLVDGDWRINRIRSYLDPPGAREFSATERKTILAQVRPDAPLPDLETGIEPNCEKLFADGREVTIFEEPSPIEVIDAGTIEIASGILGAYDFGWDQDGFRPLSRSVPPGTYRADYATVDGLVIAARVRFQENRDVAGWKPAVRLDGENHVVGVDYANVAFFDAANYMKLEKRELEDRYQDWLDLSLAKQDPQPAAGMSLTSPKEGAPDCIVTNSGVGDGGYPVYWGLDSKGEVVSLVVDFHLVGEVLEETIAIDWSLDQLNEPVHHPLLEKNGVSLSITTDGRLGAGFRVTGDRFKSARLLDKQQKTIVDTYRCRLSDRPGYQFYAIGQPLKNLEPASLEITLVTGYRN